MLENLGFFSILLRASEWVGSSATVTPCRGAAAVKRRRRHCSLFNKICYNISGAVAKRPKA